MNPPIPVYVAAPLHLRLDAVDVARRLEAMGFRVTSTWHDSADSTVEAETRLSEAARRGIADVCLAQVEAARMVVLLHGSATERCGSVFEAAYGARGGALVAAVEVGSSPRLPTILLRSERILVRHFPHDPEQGHGVDRFLRWARGLREAIPHPFAQGATS